MTLVLHGTTSTSTPASTAGLSRLCVLPLLYHDGCYCSCDSKSNDPINHSSLTPFFSSIIILPFLNVNIFDIDYHFYFLATYAKRDRSPVLKPICDLCVLFSFYSSSCGSSISNTSVTSSTNSSSDSKISSSSANRTSSSIATSVSSFTER